MCCLTLTFTIMGEINCISCPQMTEEQRNGLRGAGIVTIIDFITAPKELVVSSMEIEDADYPCFRHSVLSYLQPYPVTLRQIAVREKTFPKSTGIPSLDNRLGGGLFAGDIIEFYGEFGSAKTQLCLYFTSQFCSFSTVIYFDMQNDFSASRLSELCGKNSASLDNVIIFRPANLNKLLTKLDQIKQEYIGGINGFYSNCKLVIVDSVPMAIYPTVASDNYSWRFHQEKLVEKLQWLADNMKLTVILTNHAVRSRTSTGMTRNAGPAVKAALGKYWLHKINIRILLSKMAVLSNSPNYFSGHLEKCYRAPSGKVFSFRVKTNGIEDL